MGLGAGGSYREQLGQVHSQGFPCSFPLVPCSLLESFWYRFAKHQVWKAIGIGAVTGSLALSLQSQYNWEGILKLCKAEETRKSVQQWPAVWSRNRGAFACLQLFYYYGEFETDTGRAQYRLHGDQHMTNLVFSAVLLPPPLSSHKTQMPFPHKYFSWCLFFFFYVVSMLFSHQKNWIPS